MPRLVPILFASCLMGCVISFSQGQDSAAEDTGEPPVDWDGDGFQGVEDCDEDDPEININGFEICDGLDNDCDDEVDEEVRLTYYQDADNDGFGNNAVTVEDCDRPGGYAYTGNDCNDANPQVNLKAIEICDGIDNNCDGNIDEGVNTTWCVDWDTDGYGDPAQVLRSCNQVPGTVDNCADCDDTTSSFSPGAVEQCDGLDHDCDGLINEEDAENGPTWYQDADGDGFGGDGKLLQACQQPLGYEAEPADCDDQDPASFPGADETCDAQDNDCDGTVDDFALDPLTFFSDSDGDGYGDPATLLQGCGVPEGSVSLGTDCDDTRAEAFPGAAEICNGRDDDCDFNIDEGGGCP